MVKIFLTFFLFTVLYAEDKTKLNFGITSVTITKNSHNIFELTDFLSKEVGIQIEPKFAKNYDEMKLMLEKKEVDFAYICGATFVEAERSANLEILTFPYFENKPLYYSLVIVKSDSDAKSLLDLEKKSYAFSDPKSNSGSLVPMCRLKSLGVYYKDFFSHIIYTHDHSESIDAVVDGYVDGASVDSLVFESYKLLKPQIIDKVKIIEKTGPFQTTPVVIRKDISKQMKINLQKAFEKLSHTQNGKKILQNFGVDKFEYTDNYDYSKIKQMLECSDSDD